MTCGAFNTRGRSSLLRPDVSGKVIAGVPVTPAVDRSHAVSATPRSSVNATFAATSKRSANFDRSNPFAPFDAVDNAKRRFVQSLVVALATLCASLGILMFVVTQ